MLNNPLSFTDPTGLKISGVWGIVGQLAGVALMLGLAFARYLFALPELARVSDAAIVESVGPTIQRYLDGDIHP